MAPTQILLVEDEEAIAEVIARNLRARGHDVTLAESGKDALYSLSEEVPNVLILDINLPDITGWELLRRLSAADRDRVPIIVISASPLAPSRVQQFRPAGVLVKPFPIEALARLIEEVTAADTGTSRTEAL